MAEPSDFIVYVDESGDHGLDRVDPNYPVFVLAFCIFRQEHYIQHVVPAVQRLKFKYFGHDHVVLHEREIRKAKAPFEFLTKEAQRREFMRDLTDLVTQAPFQLIASCIRKHELQNRYRRPWNPYTLALTFNLERLYSILRRNGQHQRKTHIVFERRGKREDGELRRAFHRVCSGANYKQRTFSFEMVLADKRANSSGLQVADLVARPVGRHVMQPGNRNAPFEVLRAKFYQGKRGDFEGKGLKCFP